MHEIELKFQVPPQARAAVRLAMAKRTAQTTRLRALYYDTPDLHLARAGMALRLRLEGERWVQTFKAPGGDALRRIEHEVVLAADAVAAGPALDLARHAGSPAGAVLAGALGDAAAALRVTFETDVSRCHRVTRHGGAHIELALDVGVVRAAAAEVALHEIEFELVDGPVAGLLDLARRWVARHGLWLDVRSKAERGHLLAHGMTVASATRAKSPRVSGVVTADQALRQVVEAGLDHLLPNAAALAAGLAGDEHRAQARLGLASLREALARSYAQDPAVTAQAWAHSLAELGRQLDGEGAGATEAGTTHAWQAWAGAAMRSPAAGLLWLDLLAYALVDRPD